MISDKCIWIVWNSSKFGRIIEESNFDVGLFIDIIDNCDCRINVELKGGGNVVNFDFWVKADPETSEISSYYLWYEFVIPPASGNGFTIKAVQNPSSIFLAKSEGANEFVTIGIQIGAIPVKFTLKKLALINITGTVSRSETKSPMALNQAIQELSSIGVTVDGAVNSIPMWFVLKIFAKVPITIWPTILTFTWLFIIFPISEKAEIKKKSPVISAFGT